MATDAATGFIARRITGDWIMDYDSANCAIGAAVEIIGERASFLVLRVTSPRRRPGSPKSRVSTKAA
jgi:hypothetical protein